MQVWGGIGMTWEGRDHLFLRRALLSRQVPGHDDHHIAWMAHDLVGPDDGPKVRPPPSKHANHRAAS